MAPARTSKRRAPQDNTQHNGIPRAALPAAPAVPSNEELFLEPMMGTPLAIYVEKDVADRDSVIDMIKKYGGVVSPGYSGVPYILVDPHKESGQNLYRQYVGKKGKIVLDARWVHECVKAGALQTFQSNWAGCRVDGTEKIGAPETAAPISAVPTDDPSGRQPRQSIHPSQTENIPRQIQPAPTLHAQPMHPPNPPQMSAPAVDTLVHAPTAFPYPVYATPMHPASRAMAPPAPGPPQPWQAPGGIAPQQTHMAPPPPHMMHRPAHPFRGEPWETSYEHGPPPANGMVAGPATAGYDYRYENDRPEWVGGPPEYYDPSGYEQPYDQAAPYLDDPGPSEAGPSTAGDDADKPRGRRRTRNQPTPAAPASSLVLNRPHPLARSPAPPTRVIKSTYGGNLFTSDDVEYLKKYIDYCQEQGLVLSLREICERIAIKAPHHTFYSWRRYCNKHQIRLGGYAMNPDRSPTPGQDEGEPEEESMQAGPGPGTIAAARQRLEAEGQHLRNRSPTPPRALFRSTTGKGVAFTDEDVAFLVRFMQYRESQGRLDMVAFWKDVAKKAPHHSRASWMKFWRRHKHELNRNDADEPLPAPPEKKMRYSRGDDILLARYFYTKPEGTSDKIFQAFGRMHPHHPWKGWQEHHRIHKAKIDHFIEQLANGEVLED